MGLHALHFLEGREEGILVAEADHQADGDQVLAEVVDEAAAVGVGLHRPAEGVHDQTLLELLGIDFPQLLDADGVGLRIGVGAQVELFLDLLAQVAAAAFGEQGVLGQQFHARLVVGAGLAVAREAHVAGGDAAHRALVVVEYFGPGEAGIDLDAEGFGLGAKPAAELAQADDVIAVVRKAAGQKHHRQIDEAVLRQEGKAVARHRGIHRCSLRLPVGHQFVQRARVHDGAGEDVGADLGALLDQADVGFRIDLLEPDRSGKSGRTPAYDDDIEFHGFALHADSDRLI